ncbi:acyl-CoA dehydrogenase family protein [Tepidicaulis sp. LMO-SS28]|uniref:acyl-CoA dehydrogenase family protein n=1 Tax=Tepidicaulis sp. LMO-SS28 TaxID=3447455 RepID=UPI003EE3752F
MSMAKSAGPKDTLSLAAGFADEIAARADEFEAARQLPQDMADKMAGAGLYGMFVPEAYGGLETDPWSFIEVIERLARADASAAWCLFIGATSGVVSAFLPEAEARAIFGTPGTIAAGVFAPKGKAVREGEAFRVNGQWQWGSGSRNADWIMGGALVMDDTGRPEMMADGKPNNRMMLFPAGDVELLDTWYVSGLQGTGSTDFKVSDALVPAARSVDLVRDKPVIARPLYAFPTFGLLGMGIAAVTLGLARAAIDELVGIASEKTPQGSFKPLATKPAAHADVSEAEALTRSARAFLQEVIGTAWEAAQARGEITVEERRDLRLATTHAVKSSARAVDLMYTLGGGTSVYRASPLQRMFRDVHVATQHMMVADATFELTGRLFLGLDTDTAML